MIHQWTPQIGDPSVLGWLTVLCYFLAALLCIRAAGKDAGAASLWRVLGLALVLLGINKQLDLQTLLTQIGRDLSRSGHWYEQRRQFQRIFAVAIAVAAGLGAVVAIRMFKDRSRAFRSALIGFVFLAAFVCVRAASFHHVDGFLKMSLLGARFNWIIELGGIMVITAAAASAGERTTRITPRGG